jgi:archaellum component FlaC
MKKLKYKRESIRERLEKDEDAWLKLLGSLGDFAKYLREVKKSRLQDKNKLEELEQRIKTLEDKFSS